MFTYIIKYQCFISRKVEKERSDFLCFVTNKQQISQDKSQTLLGSLLSRCKDITKIGFSKHFRYNIIRCKGRFIGVCCRFVAYLLRFVADLLPIYFCCKWGLLHILLRIQHYLLLVFCLFLLLAPCCYLFSLTAKLSIIRRFFVPL